MSSSLGLRWSSSSDDFSRSTHQLMPGVCHNGAIHIYDYDCVLTVLLTVDGSTVLVSQIIRNSIRRCQPGSLSMSLTNVIRKYFLRRSLNLIVFLNTFIGFCNSNAFILGIEPIRGSPYMSADNPPCCFPNNLSSVCPLIQWLNSILPRVRSTARSAMQTNSGTGNSSISHGDREGLSLQMFWPAEQQCWLFPKVPASERQCRV